MQATKQAVKMHEYNVVDYFDVWGNERDGYEVNNLCKLADTITLDDDLTGEAFTLAIQDELKRIEYMHKRVNRRQWAIDWNGSDETFVNCFAPNGRPLFRLERIEA